MHEQQRTGMSSGGGENIAPDRSGGSQEGIVSRSLGLILTRGVMLTQTPQVESEVSRWVTLNRGTYAAGHIKHQHY